MLGDFNCTLLDDERSSGFGASTCFRSWVGEKGLIDLGCTGSHFTWRHGLSIENRREARLDRGLCCVDWRSMFPVASVRHLRHTYSDHCPIILELHGRDQRSMEVRPLRFQAAWLLHKYSSWMEKEWIGGGDLLHSLKLFLEKVEAWNKVVFGNIHRRKRRAKSKLEGVVRALDVAPTVSLIKLEQKLKEWMEVLIQEEVMCMQNSRVDWLQFGDRNTKFFTQRLW